MTAALTTPSRSINDDRGSGYMAAFIVLFSMLTFGGVAVVADTGRVVSAQRSASAVAFEAARAGAQRVASSDLRSGARPNIDAGQAVSAARSAATEMLRGTSGSVTDVEVRGDQVVVTVTTRVEHWFPGLGDFTVKEVGRARLAIGIIEEGQ